MVGSIGYLSREIYIYILKCDYKLIHLKKINAMVMSLTFKVEVTKSNCNF